jgi:7,8-dihydropterin-6-yl-methyl-4-(beta-D-ribofuranosyl)aminobenzene 5'-phosphate synthase
VDAADVTIVVDNAIDILAPSTEVAQRAPLVWDWSEREQLRAEHGYSLLVSVHRDGRSDTLLPNVQHFSELIHGVRRS